MKVAGKHWRSIWPIGERAVGIVDQTRLPTQFVTVKLSTCDAVIDAIRTMRVRGAPLIGVAGAYGLALAMRADASDAHLARAYTALLASRPTAVNLRWALDRMRAALARASIAARFDAGWREAARMADEDVATNRALGAFGARLLASAQSKVRRPLNVLTHCNAGWIATVDYGTALAAIYQTFDAGVPLHVWVDETRPRNQGHLTAWELAAHGVPHTLIVDNAGGHLMQHGQVDLVLVGADRVTRSGDVCNKIGTYLKALAAFDNGVPFYAAAPASTIDWSIADGQRIEIEERDGAEVRGAVVDASTQVANPAFDVTPARLVTGIITERGIAAPGELPALFEKAA